MTTPGGTRAVPVAVVGGPAGVGKTTVARALAARVGAALLDLDTLTAPLVAVVAGLLGSDDLDGATLAAATRGARYEALVDVAVDCLACRTPVVLVAPFTAERTTPAAWDALRDRLTQAGAAPTLVWVHAPREVLRGRLLARAAARDAAKLADLEAHLDRIDLRPPVAPHLAVDSSREIDLDALARALAAAGGATDRSG